MSELRKTEPITLAGCEARIQLYKEQTVGGLIGIGRTLIEAKEAKVVPHGQWEAWATEQTGVHIRQVQRMMQLARTVTEGSSLEKLDFSTALLVAGSGLAEEEQERIAEESSADHLSRSQVQQLIDEAKEQTLLEEQKRHGEELASLTRQDMAVLRETERKHEAELESLRKELTDKGNRMVLEAREKAQEAVYALEQKVQRLNGEKEKLVNALNAAEVLQDDGEAARLRAQLEDVQVLLQRQTEDRKAAQAELLRLKAGQANRTAAGEETGTLTLRAAEAARDTFLAAVSELQYMGAKFAQADETERQRWMDVLESIDRWVERSTEAVQTRDAGGVVV